MIDKLVILPDDITGEPDCECNVALQSSRSFVGSNLIAQVFRIQRKGQIMERYGDIDRDSGVAEFENGPDYIRVKFSDGSVYLYTYASAGSSNIEEMKKLALAGEGLNAFINKNVRKRYARKEK